MPLQNSVAVRNAEADSRETTTGASPVARLFASLPANCAAADPSPVLAQGTLPADWLTAASAGAKSKNGTWTLTGQAGAGAGTDAAALRIYDAAGTTCHWQMTAGGAVMIPTTATSAVDTAILTFSSTTGVAVGRRVTGTNIPADATVIALTSITVTIDKAITTLVASGVTVSFLPDAVLDNANIANGQAVDVTTFVYTCGNA